MAIREDEVERLVRAAARMPSSFPPATGMAIDLGDHAGAVAKVRRHVLRRLLIADIVGLAPAAVLGPAAGRQRRVEQPELVGRPHSARSCSSTWR